MMGWDCKSLQYFLSSDSQETGTVGLRFNTVSQRKEVVVNSGFSIHTLGMDDRCPRLIAASITPLTVRVHAVGNRETSIFPKQFRRRTYACFRASIRQPRRTRFIKTPRHLLQTILHGIGVGTPCEAFSTEAYHRGSQRLPQGLGLRADETGECVDFSIQRAYVF